MIRESVRCQWLFRTCLLCVPLLLAGLGVCRGQDGAKLDFSSLSFYLDVLQADDRVERTKAIESLNRLLPHTLPDFELCPDREFCQQAKPLLPRIVGLLQHEDEEVVTAAISLITVFRIEGTTAIPALREIVNKPGTPESIRSSAFSALLKITPESESVLRGLDLNLVLGFPIVQ